MNECQTDLCDVLKRHRHKDQNDSPSATSKREAYCQGMAITGKAQGTLPKTRQDKTE